MSAKLVPPAPRPSALEPGPLLQYSLEQFLYTEATLLDEHRFEEWLKLFTPDAHYRMPVRVNRTSRVPEREELHFQPGAAHYDDDFSGLAVRVARLVSGIAWSEYPLSRTRRLVSNVQARVLSTPGEVEVRSAFLLYRSRHEHDVDVFAGLRHDVLRQGEEPGSWRIARRLVLLDQSVILAGNLSVFF